MGKGKFWVGHSSQENDLIVTIVVIGYRSLKEIFLVLFFNHTKKNLLKYIKNILFYFRFLDWLKSVLRLKIKLLRFLWCFCMFLSENRLEIKFWK